MLGNGSRPEFHSSSHRTGFEDRSRCLLRFSVHHRTPDFLKLLATCSEQVGGAVCWFNTALRSVKDLRMLALQRQQLQVLV
jgi:hypothetical protein